MEGDTPKNGGDRDRTVSGSYFIGSPMNAPSASGGSLMTVNRLPSTSFSDIDEEEGERLERIKVSENVRRFTRSTNDEDPVTVDVHNPAPQGSYIQDAIIGTNGDRYIIAMVGLPARGKTYISRKLARYLEFFHDAPTKVFNVGNYRRSKFGPSQPHSFFDPTNEEGMKLRNECAQAAMDDLKSWLTEGKDLGRVAIYDATNSTKKRRQWILDQVVPSAVNSCTHVIFIESVCDDESLIDHNIAATKLQSPDYSGKSADEAISDFKSRIDHYTAVYQTLSDEEESMSWIKIRNAGIQVTSNRIKGFLPGRILHFVMNLHTRTRPLYLSRHGESQYNKLGKIGGDSALSPLGEEYATKLAEFVDNHIIKENAHTRLWTSSLRRTILTAKYINHDMHKDGWVTMRPKVWRGLDELHAGVFDGMTYKQIEDIAPDEFKSRKKNKMTYRYPRGESYLDVLQRLDPIIHEIERQTDPVLIIGHQGILRIIYAYFMGLKRDETPFVTIAFNTVTKLTPSTYVCKEEQFVLIESGSDEGNPSH